MVATAAFRPSKTRFSICSTFRFAASQDVEDPRQHAHAVEVPDVEGVGPEPGGSEVHAVQDLAAPKASTISTTPSATAFCACAVDAPM